VAAGSVRSAAAAELRRGGSVVRVAVAPGAPIIGFSAAGVDWCAAGEWLDVGPSAGPCALPTYVPGAAGAAFPAGGLLARAEPVIDVQADGAVSSISAWWPPAPYPLGWRRVVTLEADGALRLRYSVTNGLRTQLPFVWHLPIPLPWDAALEIDLPRGARARLASASGEGLPNAGSEFTWPALRVGGGLIDVSRPAHMAEGRAVGCFVELPRGKLAVRTGAARLEMTSNATVVSHARVSVNHDAGAHGRPRRWWHRHTPMVAVSAGPAAGAPDLLSDPNPARPLHGTFVFTPLPLHPGKAFTWNGSLIRPPSSGSLR
jgi:hypothetical protein